MSLRTLGPGTPTLLDVARTAGVSTTTVSYVLNGRSGDGGNGRISTATRERVLAATQQLGYVPNQTARSLRRQKTERICLVLQSIGVPFDDLLAASLQQAGHRLGYSFIITVSGSPESDQQIVQQFQRGLADGIVFDSPYLSQSDAAAIVRRHVALVAMSGHLEPDGFDVVRDAPGTAALDAMRHLIHHGHRRIAFIAFRNPAAQSGQRFAAYQQAMAEATIPLNDSLIQYGASSRERVYDLTSAMFAQPNRPTAIFADSDVAAITTAWAARDAGLRVPDDLAIIGAGNIPEGLAMRPSLSTIGPTRPDFDDIADLLISRLSDNNVESRLLVRPWQFFPRGTA